MADTPATPPPAASGAVSTASFLSAQGLLDFSRIRIDPGVALRFPARAALRHQVLPLCKARGTLYVAFAGGEAGRAAALAELSRVYPGIAVVLFPASREELLRHLRELVGEQTPGVAAAGGPDDAVARAENLLRAAAIRQASDIHFDPGREDVRIRFRVDGVLEEFDRVPLSMQTALVSRIKVLAGLDIAERRAPQDGAFLWRLPMPGGGLRAPRTAAAQHLRPTAYDIRVATLPVRHGERVTLRLLEADGGHLSLDALGMNAAHRAAFERVLERPYGLVLLTGPTGSGKTTTLYAAIRRLLAQAPLNILTVEDPVEYEIPGVAQCEVDSSDKVSFGKALRSLLRHDPDVVMIGEIRDDESLDTAIKAALTGHLVLSTLHANDAVATVTRLTDMGLSPHLAAATLRLSVAQRLVRRLCPVCRVPEAVTGAQAAVYGHPEWTGLPVFAPAGCPGCAGRGYVGRIGLFEFMEPDSETASAIAAGTPESEVRALLKARGFRSLSDDLIEKARAGLLSLHDAAF